MGKDKQKLLEHDIHTNEYTAARRPSPSEKCNSAVIEKVKERNEEKTSYVKMSKRAAKGE